MQSIFIISEDLSIVVLFLFFFLHFSAAKSYSLGKNEGVQNRQNKFKRHVWRNSPSFVVIMKVVPIRYNKIRKSEFLPTQTNLFSLQR